MRRGFLARNQGAGTVGKHYAIRQDRRPSASWIIVLTTLSRATSEYRVIRELRDSLPTSPVCRMRSQSTYSEIIPIVPSHVSTN